MQKSTQFTFSLRPGLAWSWSNYFLHFTIFPCHQHVLLLLLKKERSTKRPIFFFSPSFYFFSSRYHEPPLLSLSSFLLEKKKSIFPAFFLSLEGTTTSSRTETISLSHSTQTHSLSCTLLQSHCHYYIIEKKISMYFLFSCTSLHTHVCMYVFDGEEGKKKRECCY